MAERSVTRGAAALLWRRVPDAAGLLSSTLRVAMRDGDYLLSWPLAAVCAPPAALLLGLLLGAVHPGPVFASSMLVVLLLGTVAGLSAGLGLYALVGFAVGDLALHAHTGVGYPYGAALTDIVLRTDVAALDTYLVLAGLLVVAPLATTATRQRVQRFFRAGTTRRIAGFAVAAVTQAVLAFLWSQAAVVLIRPVWTFWGAVPDSGPIGTLRSGATWLALVTVLAVAGRGALTWLAAASPAPAGRQPSVRWRLRRPRPWPVPVTWRAVGITLLLAGLLGSTVSTALVFALLVGLGAVQYRLVPALPSYARTVARVPLALRAAACCALGYLMTLLVVRPAVTHGVLSFLPALVAMVPPLVLAAFLLPPGEPDGARRGPGGGRHSATRDHSAKGRHETAGDTSAAGRQGATRDHSAAGAGGATGRHDAADPPAPTDGGVRGGTEATP